jgi:hypothetical protein
MGLAPPKPCSLSDQLQPAGRVGPNAPLMKTLLFRYQIAEALPI